MNKLPSGQYLLPGHFYRSYEGNLWCCFKIAGGADQHAQAYCVEVNSHRVEYFYLDGRYDKDGKRSECLIEDMTTFWGFPQTQSSEGVTMSNEISLKRSVLRGKDGLTYTLAHWIVINDYGATVYDGLFANEARLIAKQHGLKPMRGPWWQKKFDEGFFTEEEVTV